MKNIFDFNILNEYITRINKLTEDSKPLWGKMSVDKMLAHCNVTYEFVYENYHQKPKGLKKILLKLFVKNFVVSETPYKQNLKTSAEFIIADSKNFQNEKSRLINYLKKTQELGTEYFEGRESHSFGPLTGNEWNNMFAKHLDHHLSQFGV